MRFIEPLRDIDWNKKTSPFAFLGGGKGVRRAHEVLLYILNEKGITQASELIRSQNVRNGN